MTLSNKVQLGGLVAACALAAAGAAYATSKLHRSHTTASALTPGYVGARARGWHGAPLGLRGRDDLSVAASYLGISEQSLLEQLRAGKSLAEIASATSGRSSAGLVDALVKDAQDTLAAAVKDDRLTQGQADRISAGLKARITDLVNGAFHRRPSFSGPPRI